MYYLYNELCPILTSKGELLGFMGRIGQSTQYTSILGWIPRNRRSTLPPPTNLSGIRAKPQ